MTQARCVMAFDYGQRRIGVAVGNTLSTTAQPLSTVSVNKQACPDWKTIENLVDTWQPEMFVLGMPNHADGTEHKLAGAIKHFARQLRQRFQREVTYVDERLSSNEAAQRISHSNDSSIDAMAAVVILETWFLSKDHTKRSK